MALSWIAATLLVVLCSNFNVGLGSYGGAVIHVGGKVMCQDCTKGYNEWINGDRPIKGCKVSLTCMDERKRVMYYSSDFTDEEGQFEMRVNKLVNGKELKEKLCSVRLVFSPDQTCNILTDYAGGKSGVLLKRPTLIYRDMVKFLLDPFYFTSPMCDQPDTIATDESYGTKY
ncbi:pistil-specific extensin-like protein [Mercurialis annua]|uniref:pistil-specific extensin-like protein n=1 Tax=Mercurialis annua TaxID=3986 RepID=UPI00215FC397|nr:pistil-specific extensin-like protein [Mercurialis annua]